MFDNSIDCVVTGVRKQSDKFVYLVKYNTARKLDEVNDEMMVRKFPQLTVSFLETKLDWFLPHQESDNNQLANPRIKNGAYYGNPKKIHCKHFRPICILRITTQKITAIVLHFSRSPSLSKYHIRCHKLGKRIDVLV